MRVVSSISILHHCQWAEYALLMTACKGVVPLIGADFFQNTNLSVFKLLRLTR